MNQCTRDWCHFQRLLLDWYQKHGRHSLPWRNTKSKNRSYEVLVSEIMLQQTQLKRVLDQFYFPFLQKFPTLHHLALAKEEEVLKAWQGLGYYTRARNLLALAKICQGTLPKSQEQLQKLPGIGDYTAGAIACFGFGVACAFFDSNIKRFLMRFFGLSNPSKKELQAHAQMILNTHDPFCHNQALIDLGALLCTPKNPSCLLCPVESFCQGKHNPLAFSQTKRQSLTKKTLHLGIIYQKPYLALHKSTERLYKNLYNFPLIPLDKIDQKGKKIGQLGHHYTRYDLQLDLYWCNQEILAKQDLQFFHKDEIANLPISSLTKKILDFLLSQKLL